MDKSQAMSLDAYIEVLRKRVQSTEEVIIPIKRAQTMGLELSLLDRLALRQLERYRDGVNEEADALSRLPRGIVGFIPKSKE